MKKLVISFGIMLSMCLTSAVFAEDFSYLNDLTPVQKQKLTQVQHSFKQNNDALELRLATYKNKLNQIKNLTDKTEEQINLLTSAYERNVSTLEAQQKQLKAQLEEQYKAVMSPDQFKQYQAQQLQVQNAFSDFLKK